MKFHKKTILLCAIALIACGKKAQGIKELSNLMAESTAQFHDLTTEFKGVRDSKAAAATMQKFIDTVQSLKDRGEAIRAKYPELAKEKEVPADLREKMVAYMTAARALEGEGMAPVVEKYKNSPEVMALQQQHPEYFRPRPKK